MKNKYLFHFDFYKGVHIRLMNFLPHGLRIFTLKRTSKNYILLHWATSSNSLFKVIDSYFSALPHPPGRGKPAVYFRVLKGALIYIN